MVLLGVQMTCVSLAGSALSNYFGGQPIKTLQILLCVGFGLMMTLAAWIGDRLNRRRNARERAHDTIDQALVEAEEADWGLSDDGP